MKIYGSEDLKAIAALSLDEEMKMENLKKYLVSDMTDWITTVMSALPQENRT